MSETKQVPAWIKKVKTQLKAPEITIFYFPEGKTEMVVSMQIEPEEVNFGTEERPKIKRKYTAVINGATVQFVPNKQMESTILDALSNGENHFIVLRTGTEMKNTKYVIKTYSS